MIVATDLPIKPTESVSDPHSTDQRLVADFLAGDPDAVAQVETWIRQAAFAYQRRLSVEPDDWHQELMMEVMSALAGGRFAGRARLRTYVSRLVHYDGLNRLRDQRSERCLNLEPHCDRLVDAEPSPLARALLKEKATRCARSFNA